MRRVVFESSAFDDFVDWPTRDKKLFRRLVRILKETQRMSFEGIGKPEPLKGDLAGYWSKRINDEHRLVYKVTDDVLYIASCRYHYKK